MLDTQKAIRQLRNFIADRLAQGQSLKVDEIGIMFLCESEPALSGEYDDVGEVAIEPLVQQVIAEYERPPLSPDEARKHAEELREYVRRRKQVNSATVL